MLFSTLAAFTCNDEPSFVNMGMEVLNFCTLLHSYAEDFTDSSVPSSLEGRAQLFI